MTPEEKLTKLKVSLKKIDSAIVAFSGGVDSTFLLYMAQQLLGASVLAVTFDSCIHSRRDIDQAKELAVYLNVKHRLLRNESLLENEEFMANPPERCYICKLIMMSRLKEMAAEMGIVTVMDGANADDLNDFRPGMQATAEMGIKSPLQDVGLSKEDIRHLSRQKGLSVWDKPSSPCLCSRIPYNQAITVQKLMQIEKGEELLYNMGCEDVRLRHHGELVRVEVPRGKFKDLMEQETAAAIVKGLQTLGFHYVTLDLEGLRSGSLNELL